MGGALSTQPIISCSFLCFAIAFTGWLSQILGFWLHGHPFGNTGSSYQGLRFEQALLQPVIAAQMPSSCIPAQAFRPQTTPNPGGRPPNPKLQETLRRRPCCQAQKLVKQPCHRWVSFILNIMGTREEDIFSFPRLIEILSATLQLHCMRTWMDYGSCCEVSPRPSSAPQALEA